MDELLRIGSEALKTAAINPQLKNYLLGDERLYSIVKKAADRYIGGETVLEAIEKVKAMNDNQLKCSLEYMGENASSALEANQATQEFIGICDHIINQRLHSTVSLDLSHIGLNQSEDFCLENLLKICKRAEQASIEVNISAETPEQADKIQRIYKIASSMTSGLAITLQAYLYRTAEDFKELSNFPGRIRMVKGAFITAQGQSIKRGSILNQVYLDYVGSLLESGHSCSIATHDYEIQQEAKNLVDFYRPSHEDYEFESLYGIQSHRLLQLHAEGYMAKIYFVYGREWFLYLSNRLSEYPMNIFQAMGDIVLSQKNELNNSLSL